ncbi:hypothetical protein [Alterinioella nitratireducens]|uniref:hypothetical protein n=1 Tax=Alterinioella nitratireducens TaxID=2735915 RepID=UPI00155716DF|nr:hypothetical protein [Alterinioella nitratireducens]NPD20132.1 hypothetical protein [Alterinioella nitratireducens]
MFSIFSRSFTTASRLNGWDIPEEERRQTQAMINRREAARDRAAHLRATLEESRLR